MPIYGKFLITTILIVTISELAKRSQVIGAILASLPLVSILAIIWIFVETKNPETIIQFSYQVFWAVLPSLLFFLVLPMLLKLNVNFPLSLIISCAVMASGYWAYIKVLEKLGVSI